MWVNQDKIQGSGTYAGMCLTLTYFSLPSVDAALATLFRQHGKGISQVDKRTPKSYMDDVRRICTCKVRETMLRAAAYIDLTRYGKRESSRGRSGVLRQALMMGEMEVRA